MTENYFSESEHASSGQTKGRPDVSTGDAPVNEGLETLRLLAELPPPHDLEGRVYARLSRELAKPQQRAFWSLWKPAHRLQYAGATVLMLVIGVSSWTVFHGRVETQTGVPAAPAVPTNGFGASNAARYPATVKPIKVPPAPKKKPDAGRIAKSHKADTAASQ
jgi:hypothetical protein